MSDFARLLNWLMAFCWLAMGVWYASAYGFISTPHEVYSGYSAFTKTEVFGMHIFIGFMIGAGGLLSCVLTAMLIRVYEKILPPATLVEPVQESEPTTTDGNAL